MSLFELAITAVALSMDAFAVAICRGLAMRRVTLRKALIIGLYFGVFQAAMPTVGFFAASLFTEVIEAFDHWIAFGLLAFLGIRMILESRKEDDECDTKEMPLTFKNMLPLAVATSIDAMAAGISFAVLNVNIAQAASLIGATTLVISMVGVKIGSVFGSRFKSGAEMTGGVILTLIGVKILLEHLNLLTL